MHFAIGIVVRAVSHMLYSKRDAARRARAASATVRPSRLARQARVDERDRRDTQLRLFVMCLKLWSPWFFSINEFHLWPQIIFNNKTWYRFTRTTASCPPCWNKHGAARTTRNDSRDLSCLSCREVTNKWNLGFTGWQSFMHFVRKLVKLICKQFISHRSTKMLATYTYTKNRINWYPKFWMTGDTERQNISTQDHKNGDIIYIRSSKKE